MQPLIKNIKKMCKPKMYHKIKKINEENKLIELNEEENEDNKEENEVNEEEKEKNKLIELKFNIKILLCE